jgi:cell wall-associated NlpC family hydrolase
MTDGSLKLIDTARISLSYTEMTSTLPWHHSVTAFCQWTILSGSYDALRSSVCSIRAKEILRRTSFRIVPEGCRGVKAAALLNIFADGIYGKSPKPGGTAATPMSRGLWRKSAVWAAALGAALSGAGCASSGAVPHPFPMPKRDAPIGVSRPAAPDPEVGEPIAEAPLSDPVPVERPVSGLSRGRSLVDAALTFRGVPYRNGGSDPDGFDCSGFTRYVFGRFGIALPRETRQQYGEGQAVDAEDLAPGDLLFFATVARGPSHVAIAIDRDRFVHAPSSTGVVRVERLSSTYWNRRYIGARRVKGLDRN